MMISEIFYSIQGEGIYMGLPMVFIRTSGCNLNCNWCDTKYARENGEYNSIKDIIIQISKFHVKDICLTGGEPLIQKEAIELIQRLIEEGYTVYVETNGSIYLGNISKNPFIKFSVDIKCPSSGEDNKMDFSNFHLLKHDDQIKFIIADSRDYDYAKNTILNELKDFDVEIVLTPCDLKNYKQESTNINNEVQDSEIDTEPLDLQTLSELVLLDNLKVRVLPQLHKLIWPDRTRGV